jgi:3-methylfumaryl-CoA hydratase
MDVDQLRSWIGRSEDSRDLALRRPLRGLAALLDHTGTPWGDETVPPLGHWLYFLPAAPQSALGEDGHPARGGFLPPVDLPRRMWAGGRLRFHRPIPLDAAIERRSTIEDVQAKNGSTGEMVFVTVRHEISAGADMAIEEWHDIVYRGDAASGGGPARPIERPAADIGETWRPDPVSLFRYSALTFNGHRIHYDRDYARDVEGYPGLVVHGPLSATLLVDLFLRHRPGARITAFSFRARGPLFDTAPFTLNLAWTGTGAELWTAGPDGKVAMTATLEAAP